MFDNLLGKAYEAEGETSLAMNPQVLMVILLVISLVYIVYAIGSITLEEKAAFYYEKYIFPVMNFFILGSCIGQSGHGWIFGVVDGTNKIKYTLFNIKDWRFAKYALIAGGVCILFIFVVQILLAKNASRFIRDVIFMIAISVFGYCTARFAVTVSGFFLNLLFLPTSAFAFFCYFMWPVALLLWLLPTSVIAAMNRNLREREKKAAADGSDQDEREDMDAPHSVLSMPSVITGPYGHKYTRKSINAFSAEYISTYDSSEVTIRNSDLNTAGNGAHTSEGPFYW